jgi:hypothetical protein
MANPPKEEEGGFWSGLGDGIVAGGKSTVDFVTSLGTVQGWRDLGEGIGTLGDLSNPIPSYNKVQMAMASTEYVQNIPNMSSYQIGYGLGYGTEKLAEGILLSKGAGMAGGMIRNIRQGAGFSDFFRPGATVVSNQFVYGAGTSGASVSSWGIKMGGYLKNGSYMGFHYHIHKWNW